LDFILSPLYIDLISSVWLNRLARRAISFWTDQSVNKLYGTETGSQPLISEKAEKSVSRQPKSDPVSRIASTFSLMPTSPLRGNRYTPKPFHSLLV